MELYKDYLKITNEFLIKHGAVFKDSDDKQEILQSNSFIATFIPSESIVIK